MIESKTSRWIAETHAVLSGSDKIMLTLKRWTFRATLLHANKYTKYIVPVQYNFQRSTCNYRHFNVIQTYFLV